MIRSRRVVTKKFILPVVGVNRAFVFSLCISDILFHGQEQQGEATIEDPQILMNKIKLFREKIQKDRMETVQVSSIG